MHTTYDVQRAREKQGAQSGAHQFGQVSVHKYITVVVAIKVVVVRGHQDVLLHLSSARHPQCIEDDGPASACTLLGGVRAHSNVF
jgi:hypothetical protein